MFLQMITHGENTDKNQLKDLHIQGKLNKSISNHRILIKIETFFDFGVCALFLDFGKKTEDIISAVA